MISPGQKLRIIVGGMVGQFPFGGVAWDYFHYLLGLHALGHDVYYHEDTWTWPFNPMLGHVVDDPSHSVQFIADFFTHHAPELADRWHYLLLHDRSFGMSRVAFDEIARTADVFLNVSGACFFPEQLNPQCVKVFLDTDPGYNHFVLSEQYAWSKHVQRWSEQVAAHDQHFTYAENIFGSDCVIPRLNFDWKTTRCVVTLPSWADVRARPISPDAPFTSVLTLGYFPGPLTYGGKLYDAKAVEFEKFTSLCRRTPVPLRLAIGGDKVPLQPIRDRGWDLVDAVPLTQTTADYMGFIGSSAGEWSVAKNVYVDTHSGWFSCRTACYLAAGRPAVVQETGWSRFIPSGAGVLAFRTVEEAAAALETIAADPLRHRTAAYEIAQQYLTPEKVLTPMLASVFSRSSSAEVRG